MGLLTIFVVYTLILVGGVVRATGSGMGCPDWPKCFGAWVPPTSEAQLPDNYQQLYADRGYLETEFNVKKTWTEYANRLLGVTTGFLIFLTLIFSVAFLKRDKHVFYFSLAAFLLVGFQGWLGSKVVASNLLPGMITIHMITAQVIVALLIYAITRSQKEVFEHYDMRRLPQHFATVLKVAMGMTLLQMTMGTQVREAIDIIAHHYNYTDRNLWIDKLPIIFLVHRSFSSIILFTNLWLIWRLLKTQHKTSLPFKVALALGGLVLSAIVLGVAMDRLNVPAFAQPLHMWVASLIFGAQFFLFMIYRYASAAEFSQPDIREAE
jgi:cytochrome c oxidase assembly protein subunit 15